MALVCRADAARDLGIFHDSHIAFGVFDGVHKGHAFLIGQTQAAAANQGGRSVVLTFTVDPDELFRADELRKLMSNGQRIAALEATGVDAVVLLPFDAQMASLDPLAFLERTFYGAVPASLHVGSDFRFGAKGAGTVSDLRFWADRTGTEVFPYALLEQDGQPITATRIRALLQAGNVRQAADLLGHPYAFEGTVVKGRQEGEGMGFRTANLNVPAQLQAAADGVYGGYAVVGGRRYKAAVSLGVSPTFEQATATCEAHILDFDEDIYGQTIQIQLVEWLRPMRTFPSTEQLIATVTSNIRWCRDNL
ncbi:MAG: riboflavin biosynthesis protein RibF [Coriobacteriia bacterium]|nr:riboflavin biosynthesis protein RibF [Coriobacteriia bacterium]